MKEVTLVMPCYNTAGTLPTALNAIFALDPAPVRVLCIDDGSTDETVAILRDDERVDLVEHERNRGIGATLNTALDHTETKWFAKIDADIVVPPTWLADIAAAQREHDAAFVQGRFEERVVTSADRWRKRYPSPHFGPEPLKNKPLNGATILAKTEALRAVGGWDEQYRRAFDDIDLMRRLIAAGYGIYYTPDACATHIRRDTWRSVLRTDWAYHNDPIYGGKPDRLADLLPRFQYQLYVSIRYLYRDLRKGDLDLAWISALRPPYHFLWDLKCVLDER